MSHVFVSHVEEDGQIALEIARGLEEAGYKTWYHERDSLPGPSYLAQVGAAIEQSSAIVLVISADSLGSNQVTNEVIRGYESNKPFIPVLRDIKHVEFQQRQPVWRQALAASTSLQIPNEAPGMVIPRVIAGLKALGVEPVSADHMSQVAPDTGIDTGLVHVAQKSSKRLESRAAQRLSTESTIIGKSTDRERTVTHNNWFRTGIVLTSLGLISQFSLTPLYNPSTGYRYSLPVALIIIVIFTFPFIISGVICLRKGAYAGSLTKPADEHVSNLWWLLPLLLSFIGGVISWMKLHDQNLSKAMNMLTLGVVSNILWVTVALVLQFR